MLRVAVALALCLALAEVGAEETIYLRKCCDINEVLNVTTRVCVRAPWPQYTHEDISRNVDVEYYFPNIYSKVLFPPLNESWLGRWLPPGLPLRTIVRVRSGNLKFHREYLTYPLPVHTSGLATDANGDEWRDDRALFSNNEVLRNRGYGIMQPEPYCVDAATQPFPAPFALMLEEDCKFMHDCVETCCRSGVLTVSAKGSWSCSDRPFNLKKRYKALRNAFGPEVAMASFLRNKQNASSVYPLSTHAIDRSLTATKTEGFFSTTRSCVGFTVGGGGREELVALHFVRHRWARAFYWATRPLSFASSLLLLAALAAIGTSPRLRTNVHGWTLGCHAGCLLAFNLLQGAFSLSLSDETHFLQFLSFNNIFHRAFNLPRRKCLTFALPAYFFLTAANCWLTALCFNMSTGFKATRATLTGGRKRRFLKLSAFAWGIPVVLTAACAYNFLDFWTPETNPWTEPPWYIPSLMETRTCFDEGQSLDGWVLGSRQWGSALYYYAPGLALSAVNVVCVARTALRVRFLTRGNSVLRRDSKERRSKKGRTRDEATAPQHSVSPKKTQRVGTAAAPRRVSVYIRLLLSGGTLELIVETVLWATARTGRYANVEEIVDHTFSYRAVCFLTDLFRAAVVLWLAAPEAGELRGLRRRLRRGCGKILSWQ